MLAGSMIQGRWVVYNILEFIIAGHASSRVLANAAERHRKSSIRQMSGTVKIDQEEEEAAANRQRPMPAGARVYENDPFSSGQGPHNTKVYVRNIGRDNRGKISLYSKTPEEGTRGARSTGTGEGDSGQTSSAKTRETGTRETKVKSKQSSSGKDKSSTSTDSKSASAEEETITATVADNLMHVR